MLLIAMQQQTKVHFLQQTILLKTAHEAVHSALHHQVGECMWACPTPLWDMHGPEAAYVYDIVWMCTFVCTYRYVSNQTVIFLGSVDETSGPYVAPYVAPNMTLKSVFTTKVAICSGVPRGFCWVCGTDQLLAWLWSEPNGKKRWGTALAVWE